jgi:hypothetical protein
VREVLITLILAGLLVGRWWMLVVGPAIWVAIFVYRCKLILPGPAFFLMLACQAAANVAIGLVLRAAGRGLWRLSSAAWERFVWPRLGRDARGFLTLLRRPLRLSIIAAIVWPALFFGVWFFLHPVRRADPTPVPLLPIQVGSAALAGILGGWVGYRLTRWGGGGIRQAALGALTVVLVTDAAFFVLGLPIEAFLYLCGVDVGGTAWVLEYARQLATSSTLACAGATLGYRFALVRATA